jgi:peptidoglycan/xylan/chitin deacetylase (PgdA/CDA1 family)
MRSQKIACLSIDVEPDLWCPKERLRLFESASRLDALCSLFRRNGVPLTCFVVMKHATRYKEALASVADAVEIELAVHSFSHDQRSPATADEVRRAWDTYCDIWNREPRGYRAPNCLIDAQGLRNLSDQGFLYDSSVTPSIRLDRFGYNNWHLPTKPFLFESAPRNILELPIACFSGIRVPLVLSYVKLFGLRAYEVASRFLSLPNIAVVYFHAYDLYITEIADNCPGWKKYAHLRNGGRGLQILDDMIGMMKQQGYQFMLMECVARNLMQDDLPVLSSLGSERDC